MLLCSRVVSLEQVTAVVWVESWTVLDEEFLCLSCHFPTFLLTISEWKNGEYVTWVITLFQREVGACSIKLAAVNNLHVCFNGLCAINHNYKPAIAQDKSVKTSVCCLLKNLPANPYFWKKFQGDNPKLLCLGIQQFQLAKKGIMKHISTDGTVFWKKFKCNFQNSSAFRDP